MRGRLAIGIAAALALALGAGAPAPAAPCAVVHDVSSSAPVCSTGTVVVAVPDAGDIVAVGTSTITVRSGATVGGVRDELAASDGSAQTYAVTDAGGHVKGIDVNTMVYQVAMR
jgi:hypothetical protein